MGWYGERPVVEATGNTMYRDHFDASMWQDTFCKDLLIAENGGPAKNVGLEFCADGVNPYKRKSYSMWFGALSVLHCTWAQEAGLPYRSPCNFHML